MPHAVAVVRLLATKEVGPDLLAQCYAVTNFDGMNMLWVGDRDETKVQAERTVLKVWLVAQEEYDDLPSAIAAWRKASERERKRDVMAEALRRLIDGLKRPLWTEMSTKDKATYLQCAEHLMNLLNGFGAEIVVSGEDNGRTAA